MTRVNTAVTYPLKIVTHANDASFEGDFDQFFPAVCEDSSGFSICPAMRVNDPSEGFLDEDFFFRVRAEIRLKLQDNERWTVSVKRKTATCTVCVTSPSKHIDVSFLQWKLKGLQGLCPSILWSEFFSIRQTKWCIRYLLALPVSSCMCVCSCRRLALLLSGNTSNSDKISLYLTNNQDHSARVRLACRTLNRRSTKKTSEDKAESQRIFQETFIAKEILQNSPRALKQTVVGAFSNL